MTKLLLFTLLGLFLIGVIIVAVLDIEIKRDTEKIEKINDIRQHREYFHTKDAALDEEFRALSEFVHMWTDPGVPAESYYARLPQIEDAIIRMQEINSERSFIGEEMRAYLKSLRAERKDDE